MADTKQQQKHKYKRPSTLRKRNVRNAEKNKQSVENGWKMRGKHITMNHAAQLAPNVKNNATSQ